MKLYQIPTGTPPSVLVAAPAGTAPAMRVFTTGRGNLAEGATPCAPTATPAPGDEGLVAQLSRGRSSVRAARRTGRGVRDVSPRIPGATTPRGAA